MTKLTIKREQIYGGPVARGKRFHYVASFAGEQIATAETAEDAEQLATATILGALRQQSASIYASVTQDGHVVTTREYAPGQVQFAHHRDPDGRDGSVMMSNLQVIDPKTYQYQRVTVAEFHQHYLDSYNQTVADWTSVTV